jgi:hypothetical protein
MNIYSITGTLIKRNIPLTSMSSTVSIAGFVPGIYILQVTDEPAAAPFRETFKIIVE